MMENLRDPVYARLWLRRFKSDVFVMTNLRQVVREGGAYAISRFSDDQVIDEVVHLLASGLAYASEPAEPFKAPSEAPQHHRIPHQGADVVYFDRAPGLDAVEFERALKMAEDEVNQLPPQQYLNRLKELERRGAKALRNTRAQARARKVAIGQYKEAMPFLFQMLREEYPQLNAKEAAASLSREVGGSKFSNLHIEHRLDIGGGGASDKFAGLGDGKINSWIGGQWKERLGDLKRCAEEAMKRGQNKMNVRFAVRR